MEDDACLESVSTKSSGLYNKVTLGLPAMILLHSEIVGKLLAVDIANILTMQQECGYALFCWHLLEIGMSPIQIFSCRIPDVMSMAIYHPAKTIRIASCPKHYSVSFPWLQSPPSASVQVTTMELITAAPPVLSMWPNKRKVDEEKSKHAGLVQQNGFGPAFFLQEAGERHSRA
jgi:hypothetical protein